MKKLYVLIMVVLRVLPAVAQENSYNFGNTFNETFAAGPALTEALACVATTGSFSSSIINRSSGTCGTGPVTVFNFNQGAGLSYGNSTVTGTYTVHIFFSFASVTGYRRIIDFLDGQTDVGLYILDGSLNFFPNGNVGTLNSFAPNTFYLLSLVRDGSTNQIQIYLNGTSFGTYTDAAGNYKTATNMTPIYLFRDNIAGGPQCESSAGKIKYFSIKPAVSSPVEVAATYGSICAIALPVTLVRFTVEGDGRANRLEWQSAEEVNVYDYAVQRSVNGRIWKQIMHLPARGAGTYSCTDQYPEPGTNYYRLSITDLDGSSNYSKVIAIGNGSTTNTLTVVKTPDQRSIMITNSLAQLNGCTGIVYDVQGRKIYQFVVQPSQMIDITTWSPGLYLVRLPNDRTFKITK